MNYFLPAALRDALLEYMEQREDVNDGPYGTQKPNAEMGLALLLRDLKPLREVPVRGHTAEENARAWNAKGVEHG